MLEIAFLVFFCKKLAGIARDKNRSGGWGALGVLLWIGGEVGGAVLSLSMGKDGMELYGYALLGAGLGAVLAFVIVKSLAPVPLDTGLPQARIV